MVVMEIEMSRMGGTLATRKFSRRSPPQRVVITSKQDAELAMDGTLSLSVSGSESCRNPSGKTLNRKE